MADDDIDSGLLGISLSDSEDGDAPTTTATRDRKGQSDASFQAVKQDFRPKVENGEVSHGPPCRS